VRVATRNTTSRLRVGAGVSVGSVAATARRFTAAGSLADMSVRILFVSFAGVNCRHAEQ
jgi:hypothetical protein